MKVFWPCVGLGFLGESGNVNQCETKCKVYGSKPPTKASFTFLVIIMHLRNPGDLKLSVPECFEDFVVEGSSTVLQPVECVLHCTGTKIMYT